MVADLVLLLLLLLFLILIFLLLLLQSRTPLLAPVAPMAAAPLRRYNDHHSAQPALTRNHPMKPPAPTGNALRLETLEGNIALLTFDQPGSRANTLGQAVQTEFEAALHELTARTDLRGLVLPSGKPGMLLHG